MNEKHMNIGRFDYQLPRELIAQWPLEERDESRLLVVDRKTGGIRDAEFSDFPEYIFPEDVLVVNNCRVMPGRLKGRRKTGARLELTLLERSGRANGHWEALVKGRQPKEGEKISLEDGMEVEFLEPLPFDLSGEKSARGGRWRLRLSGPEGIQDFLEKRGEAPLPPYIRRSGGEAPEPDRSRYQTIFARRWGAAAAPTAGFHFTESLLKKIKLKGANLAEITLWVSYGTFAPVRVRDVTKHKMYSERFALTEQAASEINDARAKGGRVVAVGTTVVRTLEHTADESGAAVTCEGETGLFIFPGYRFRAVDAMLTNFHMPRSTLLMLVMAFAGEELIKEAYRKAVDLKYRFLSFGDAMLIL